MTNSNYCYWHNPDVVAKRAEAQRKGGQNRRVGKQSNHGRYSIKTVSEVLKALGKIKDPNPEPQMENRTG